MNKFTEKETQTLLEYGFNVEPNFARKVRESIVETISKTTHMEEDNFITEVTVKKFHVGRGATSIGEALGNIDILRDQIRTELKQLLQLL